ncbi:MAG TPA: 2-oxo-4-hydroxy-4-carboxy-5-ureidoimidazoline decarboxylase [Burkholderiales bacterium]|nr:2-oxo-4-hydroxy-4-carboxy-5-ureidoimidazoline decarboxylase [Burkholderiales bacterium]
MTLAELNRLAAAAFVDKLGAVFEHSPWVAQRAYDRRPFGSIDELHRAMMSVVLDARPTEQLLLLCAHPELAGAEARQGTLTVHSTGEQARLGLNALSRDEFRRIGEINRGYFRKFGFPCIVALKLHASRDNVLAEMERRLANSREEELRTALEQIGHITRGRLDQMFGGH